MTYWKREALVYLSGVLEDIAPGVASPRCYGVDEQQDGTYHLWLEDLEDGSSLGWPIGRHIQAARHLGRFNGEYLTGRALPDHPWLCTDFLRSWFVRFEHGYSAAMQPENWEDPFVRSAFPEPVADRVQRLIEDRDRLVSAIAELPRTLCHHDAQVRNLFGRLRPDGQAETVLIDWALLGVDTVGLELGLMIVISAVFAGLDAHEALAHEAELFDGYVHGLRDAGWQGDRETVRAGYAAAIALMFSGPTWLPHVTHDLDASRVFFARMFGRSIDEMLPRWAALQYFVLDCGDEARRLLGLR